MSTLAGTLARRAAARFAVLALALLAPMAVVNLAVFLGPCSGWARFLLKAAPAC